MASETSIQTLAVVISTLIIVPFLIIFVVLTIRCCLTSEVPFDSEVTAPAEVVSPTAPDLSSENDTEAGKRTISRSYSIQKDIVISQSGPSKYAEGADLELIYDDDRTKNFYATIVDKEVIKVVSIYSRVARQRMIAYELGDDIFEREPAPVRLQSRINTAPLAFYTHLEAEAVSLNPPFILHWWNVLQTAYFFIERTSVYFIFPLAIAAIAISFYIPGTFDTSVSGVDRALQSKQLTQVLFALTLIAFFFHLLLLWGNRTNPRSNTVIWVINVASIVLLLIALCLCSALLSFAFASQSSSSGNDDSNSWGGADVFAAFTCTCPAIASAVPSFLPTQSPNIVPATPSVSDSYSFQCTDDQFISADYNTCSMNCGVCGATYYDTFVTYTVFMSLYFGLYMYLLCTQVFAFTLVAVKVVEYARFNPRTRYVVTLHGSGAFGYPLTTMLGKSDTLSLISYLGRYQLDEKERRVTTYPVQTATASTVKGPGISGSFTQSLKSLYAVVKFVLSLLGIPLPF